MREENGLLKNIPKNVSMEFLLNGILICKSSRSEIGLIHSIFPLIIYNSVLPLKQMHLYFIHT